MQYSIHQLIVDSFVYLIMAYIHPNEGNITNRTMYPVENPVDHRVVVIE
jgi:hypothetical protein